MIKKLAVVFILVVLMLSIGTAAYASKGTERTEKEKLENKAKVDEMLSKVNSEIKEDYTINAADYIELDVKKLNAVLADEYEGLKDQELSDQLGKILRESLVDLPIGSTKPVILINKNKKVIIFGYKDSAGNNILDVFATENSDWKHEHKNMQGEPIPKID